jgi:hypothetical protein
MHVFVPPRAQFHTFSLSTLAHSGARAIKNP